MNPGTLIRLLAEEGIELRVNDEGHLRYRGPKGAYSLLLKEEVGRQKNELIDDWRCLWVDCQVITDTFYGVAPERLCLDCHRRLHPRAPGNASYVVAGEPPVNIFGGESGEDLAETAPTCPGCGLPAIEGMWPSSLDEGESWWCDACMRREFR